MPDMRKFGSKSVHFVVPEPIMVKASMSFNGFCLKVELCESDSVWKARCLIAEELNEEVPRINIQRNTLPLWDDYELLGKDDVSVILSDVRVELEVVKAAATFDFAEASIFRFPTSQRFRVVFINWDWLSFLKVWACKLKKLSDDIGNFHSLHDYYTQLVISLSFRFK